MKKLLISILSLIIMAFVVILFVNAEGSKKDSRKAKTEVVAAPCPATCTSPAVEKTAACDPATCTAHTTPTCAATCGSKTPVTK